MKHIFTTALCATLFFSSTCTGNFGFSFACTQLTHDLRQSDNTLSAGDMLYALNWLYSGYQRSIGTIKSQEISLSLLNSSWKSWQIVTHRRRNPSKTAPHSQAYTSLDTLAQDTQSALEHYQSILDEYDSLSTRIFTSHCIKNEILQSLLDAVKMESRIKITASLVNVKSLIDECSSLNWVFKGVSRLNRAQEIDIDEIEPAELAHRSLLGTIREKLPGFAFNSFANVDIGYVKASDSHWALLYNAQLASTAIWKAVETARAQVFKDAYEILYIVALDRGITPVKLTLSSELDSAEIIALPHPNTLESLKE